MAPEQLLVGGLVARDKVLFAVPGLQQLGGGGPGPLVVRAGEGKDLLPVEAAGQLLHGLGLPIHPGPQLGHGEGRGLPEAHAVGVALRLQLKPEGGQGAGMLQGLVDAQPQVILIGPPAEEPPGIHQNFVLHSMFGILYFQS